MPTRRPVHQPHRTTGVPTYQPPAAKRLTTAQRGYGSRWQTARKTYLARHPLCAICAAVGRITAATVVDHIKPHQGDQVLFWDTSNWEPVCKPCHDVKTAKEDGGFGNARVIRAAREPE